MRLDREDEVAVLAPTHVRAARAWVGWSQSELAEKAGIGVSTVADFERWARTPFKATVQAMRTALEAEGMCFLPTGVFMGSLGHFGEDP